MYRTLLKYYFIFIVFVLSLILAADYYFQNHINELPPKTIELDHLVTMVNQYCQKHACTEASLPFSNVNLLPHTDVAFSESSMKSLSQGQWVTVHEQPAHIYYYHLYNHNYVLELGPFPFNNETHFDLYTLIFLTTLAGLFLLMAWPLFREMWKIKDAAAHFSKSRDLNQLQLPDAYFFAPVKETLQWLINKIAKLLALQKELSTTLTHEIRTNLASLKFSLAGLNSSNINEVKAQMQHDIKEIEEIVEQYLSFAKQEHEIPELNLQPVKLEQEIACYLNKVEVFSDKKVTFTVVNNLPVMADMNFLTRAIRNLIDNAFKYSTSKIEIKLYQEGQYLVLKIDDDGAGINSDKLDELFMPFIQKDHSQLGYGLGLAITRKIIEWHKGKINASQSKTLTGASFKMKIPLQEQTDN